MLHIITKLNIKILCTVEFPLILYCKLVDIDGAPIINEFEFDASDMVDNASTVPESNEGVKRSYTHTCLNVMVTSSF